MPAASKQEPPALQRDSGDGSTRPPTPAWLAMPRYLFIAGSAAAGPPPVTAQLELDRRQRIRNAAAALEGRVERHASPFGEGMIYTICELPSNRAAASFAAMMRAAYGADVRTVAFPKPSRRLSSFTRDLATKPVEKIVEARERRRQD